MDSSNHSHVFEALNNLQRLLQCSNCLEYMESPIYQCKNGHTICSNCKQCWPSCPSCRVKLGDIRCLLLEKMADSLVVNCTNKNYGCPHIMPYNTMYTHEASCNFLPYACPLNGTAECKFPAGLNQQSLVSHLTEYHKAERINCKIFQPQFVVKHLSELYKTQVTIINCLGRYFCLHSETLFIEIGVFKGVFKAFITLIGDQADASKYRYRLQIGNNNGMMSIYEGVPRSIRESSKFSWKTSDSLFVLVRAEQFDGNTGEINVEVTGHIWETKVTKSTHKTG